MVTLEKTRVARAAHDRSLSADCAGGALAASGGTIKRGELAAGAVGTGGRLVVGLSLSGRAQCTELLSSDTKLAENAVQAHCGTHGRKSGGWAVEASRGGKSIYVLASSAVCAPWCTRDRLVGIDRREFAGGAVAARQSAHASDDFIIPAVLAVGTWFAVDHGCSAVTKFVS